MEQDWLTSVLKFIRLNLGFLMLAIGFCLVFAWGGYRVTRSFFAIADKPLVQQTASHSAVVQELTATPVPTIAPSASSAPSPSPLPTVQPTVTPTIVLTPKPVAQSAPVEILKEAPHPETYLVKPGDSTSKIAQNLWGNGNLYPAIEKANNFKHNQRLSIGQKLIIPAKPVEKSVGKITSGKSIEIISGKVVDTTLDSKHPATTAQNSYVVKTGDSLWKIAKEQLGNPYAWVQLYQLNKKIIGHTPNLIYPGSVLQLPQH